MWGFGLTIITIFWLLTTSLGIWWMVSVESSWRRIAWGCGMVLLPVLGVILWMIYGREGAFPTSQNMQISAEKDSVDPEKTA